MTKRHALGFTLIELMVVMAILVLLSVVSYRAMITALDTREAVTHYNQRLREVELGLFLLAKDLQQIQRAPLPVGQRPFASNYGVQEQSQGELFQLFRSADAEMQQGVVAVRYQLSEGKLMQVVEGEQQSFKTPIMTQIVGARVDFYDALGRKFSTWHQPMPPQAVEITLRHQRYGLLMIKEGIL